jgi:hypothetical protein
MLNSHAQTYLMVAVRKVEPGDVHTGVHQCGQTFLGPTSGADGAHNLGSTAKVLSAKDIVVQRPLDLVEGDVLAARPGETTGKKRKE